MVVALPLPPVGLGMLAAAVLEDLERELHFLLFPVLHIPLALEPEVLELPPQLAELGLMAQIQFLAQLLLMVAVEEVMAGLLPLEEMVVLAEEGQQAVVAEMEILRL